MSAAAGQVPRKFPLPADGAGVLIRERPMPSVPTINGERLWSRLMQMGQVGATAHGGCNRQALTELDFEGRRLLMQWAGPIGCEVRVDSIGNLFLRRAGTDKQLPAVLTGSHLD